MGPIPWFIIPEYFSDKLRPTATAIVSTSNWLFSFSVIFMWPAMKKGIGIFGSLVLFACITLVSVIFGVFCIKEPREAKEKMEKSSGNKEAQSTGDVASMQEN
jgi:SP family facilitated glucose transporter-like MFS transporter 2